MNRKRHLDEDLRIDSYKRLKEDNIKNLNDTNKGKFLIGRIEKYDFKFPFFRQPKEIGFLSLDINRKFSCDKSQLKYYVKPQDMNTVSLDLKKGYAEMIRKDDNTKEYLNDILLWIKSNLEKFSIPSSADTVQKDKNIIDSDETKLKKRCLNTDFICWRGLLTKLLTTPYENRDGWMIGVTLFSGTYYLCEFETEEKKHQRETTTQRQDEMCCWGWKFEQYLTADSPSGTPDTDSPYNNCEAFCTVVRSRLNDHSLVFSGEVDAVSTSSVNGKDHSHYVEMKTTREIDNQRQDMNFKRFKLIKWWIQSFLVGIPEIICGYRDDDGIVHRLESIQTHRIPDMIKMLHNPWKPAVCFNFLDKFLAFIKQTVKEDNCKVVYLLQWKPHQDITCEKLPPDSDYKFLPDWYIKQEVT